MLENIGMIETTPMAMIGELRKVLKRLHYPLEVMLVCARHPYIDAPGMPSFQFMTAQR